MTQSTFEIKTDDATFVVGTISFNGEQAYCIEDFMLNDPIKNFRLPEGINLFKTKAFNTLYNQRQMDPRELNIPEGLKFNYVNRTGSFYGITSKSIGHTLVDFEAKGNESVVEIPSIFTNIHPDAFKTHLEEEKFNGIFNSHNNHDFSE